MLAPVMHLAVLALSPRMFSMALAAPTGSPVPFNLLKRESGYLLIGGGVANYLVRAVRNRVGSSGNWNLRFGVGNRGLVSGELGYVGSLRA